MSTSPYPHLDEIVWRLRQLPEVEALLQYGFNGEPIIQVPLIHVEGLTDIGLIMRLQAHMQAYFCRLAYVAGGARVTVRAQKTIENNLTWADVRAIRVEYANFLEIDLDSSGQTNGVNDVLLLIFERLLLSDDQFQRSWELTQAIGRHLRRNKR